MNPSTTTKVHGFVERGPAIDPGLKPSASHNDLALLGFKSQIKRLYTKLDAIIIIVF